MWGLTVVLHYRNPPITVPAIPRTAHGAPETGVSQSTYKSEVQTSRLAEGSTNVLNSPLLITVTLWQKENLSIFESGTLPRIDKLL